MSAEKLGYFPNDPVMPDWRGYNAAAWAFTISAFCLGLLVGAENTTNGKFKVPFLSGQHHRHLIHHTASR
jgi:hypothetical protein